MWALNPLIDLYKLLESKTPPRLEQEGLRNVGTTVHLLPDRNHRRRQNLMKHHRLVQHEGRHESKLAAIPTMLT